MHMRSGGSGGQGAAFADHAPSELLSLVLDRTTDGVLVADGDGVMVYVNEPLAEMFGYKARELLGEPIEMLMPDNQRERSSHSRREVPGIA